VDKRQILALFGCEGICRATHAGHPIQLVVSSSNAEERSMNVRYRVELSQAERDELLGFLRGGKHSARKLKRARLADTRRVCCIAHLIDHLLQMRAHLLGNLIHDDVVDGLHRSNGINCGNVDTTTLLLLQNDVAR